MKNPDFTFVTAPDGYLSSIPVFGGKTLPKGKFIYPEACLRGYLNKTFCLSSLPEKATAYFLSDNKFDLFINGLPVNFNNDVAEVTSLLKKGKNLISVRVFQTDSPDHVASALIGEIRLDNKDKTEYITTDENFKSYTVGGFFSDYEPEDWNKKEDIGELHRIVYGDVHMRSKRRSCYFKKNFIIEKAVKKAELSFACFGLAIPFVNGIKVTDDRFLTGSHEQAIEYVTYDVTPLIKTGGNAFAFLTGNGWLNSESTSDLRANKPSVAGVLDITYVDGTTKTVSTDKDVSVHVSPYLENDIHYGERYDARLEIEGFADYSCADDGWAQAEIITPPDLPVIKQNYPPVRVYKSEKPISTAVEKGKITYEFPLNLSGRVKICITGANAGDKIELRYYERKLNGELCSGEYDDVRFPTDSYTVARYAMRNIDVYFAKGGTEYYEPVFTYTGFKFATVTFDNPNIKIISATAERVFSDLTPASKIETTDEFINNILSMSINSVKSNFVSGPTDCPTREKNFWNGDIQTFGETACWYFDQKDFLSAWSAYGRKMERGIYGWEDEEYLLPLTLYKFYGDKSVLEIKYPIIKNLLVKRKADVLSDGSINPKKAPYCDHLSVLNLPADFFAFAFYTYAYYGAGVVAGILGKTDDKEEYFAEFTRLKKEFNKRYFIKEKADYSPDIQGGQALPLALNLVPDGEEKAVINSLINRVEREKRATTGYICTPFLLKILRENGRNDLAYKIFTDKNFPSLGYVLSTGGTTTTESWNGYNDPSPHMSMNHFALGAIIRYLFDGIAGINPNLVDAGFKKFTLSPYFPKDLNDFKATYLSPYGEIISGFIKKDGKVYYTFTVPEGTSAELSLDKKVYGEGTYTVII